MTDSFEYDIAISYAGEDQSIASDLAKQLQARGLKVFFASAQQAALLGTRLEEVLSKAFGSGSRYVLTLVSAHYPTKEWARFELQVAHEEENRREEPFVLPLLLADIELEQIPHDKVSFDLRKVELDEVVKALVEKVLTGRGDLAARETFDRAYREWKTTGIVPGMARSDIFWNEFRSLDLDEERCEFLLHCPGSEGDKTRDVLRDIDPDILRAGGERLLAKADTPTFRLRAIEYIGLADSVRAEAHLCREYEDEDASVNDRARAFELLWKCPSRRARDEPKRVLLDRKAPWQLRRAAAVNVLWGEPEPGTLELLARALRDPRREVRSKVIEAILRFQLADLSPDLIAAHRKDRSRKGKKEIERALRHFSQRPDVVEFGKAAGLGPAFFKPPIYVHDWEAQRPDW